MKRILSLLIVFVILMSFVPMNIVATESSANDFKYEIKNNEVTINRYNGTATELIIPSTIEGYPVVNIRMQAFYQCNSLYTVVIPNSVKNIGAYAFECCDNLTKVVIPDSVTSLESGLFRQCSLLSNIIIPNSVTSIGGWTFSYCRSLESIVIPNSVKSIGDYAFAHCNSLKRVVLLEGVTKIDGDAFKYCSSLAQIVIPKSIESIGTYAFSRCESLTDIHYAGNEEEWEKISIGSYNNPLKNATIHFDSKNEGEYAEDCEETKGKVTYNGNCYKIFESGKTWEQAKTYCESIGGHLATITSEAEQMFINSIVADGTNYWLGGYRETNNQWHWITQEKWEFTNWADGEPNNYLNRDENCLMLNGKQKWNDQLKTGDPTGVSLDEIYFVCEWEAPTDKEDDKFDKPTENESTMTKEMSFEETLVFLDIGETCKLTVHMRDVNYVNGCFVYSNNRIVESSDIDWNSETYEKRGIIKVDDDGQVTALSKGVELILVNSKEEGVYPGGCHIFVGEPNELQYTSTHDTKHYYYEGGFYSEKSSVSDCVELYLLFQNELKEIAKNITEMDKIVSDGKNKELFKDIKPITITASIDGEGLSFDRKTNQKTYTTVLETLSFGDAMDDLLMLFPHNLKVPSGGKHYNVTVTLTSESFDTVTYKHSFVVENLESKFADEHIDFATSNALYKIFKNNDYGKEMVKIKNNADYMWSKVLETASLEFEDYYKIVFADLMMIMTNNYADNGDSMFMLVKEWANNYNEVLSEIVGIVNESYDDITPDKVDELLKKSKYRTEGMNVKDNIRDFVVLKLRDKVSIDKINSVFAKIDKSQQILSFVNLGEDILIDIKHSIDNISVLNAYKQMGDDFKEIINNLFKQIPDSETHLKKAILFYIGSDSFFGYSAAFINEVKALAGNISIDTCSFLFKDEIIKYICDCAGKISMKSGIFIGVEAGVLLSDILFDSSGRAEEMSKIVAISEFSPYVVDTLDYYEKQLCSERNFTAVARFEYAFALHKATQSYMIQHTIKSLEVAGESLFSKLLGREDDDDGLISEMLVQKHWIDNLNCCDDNDNSPSTVVNKTKVVAVKCPVNVFVYDESGQEVVRIVNDSRDFVAEGITVSIKGGEKYIVLPGNQKYSVEIIATNSGTMEYVVTEYDGIQRLKTIRKDNIELESNREFIGQIPDTMNVDAEEYALKCDNRTIIADDIAEVPVTGIEVSVDNITMNVGETRTLSAIIYPSNATNQKVSWKIDNPDVAVIDKDGNITALSKGSAVISVLSNDWGYVDTCTINISCTHTGETEIRDCVYGDSTGDQKIDMKDVVMLRKYITNFDFETNTSSVHVGRGADANGDNKIDMKDVVILRKYITNYDFDTESSTVILGPQ